MVVALLMLSVPAQAGTIKTMGPFPCVDITQTPPSVQVGPCASSTSGHPIGAGPSSGDADTGPITDLEAIHEDVDVTVQWTLDTDEEALRSIHVFRGADETTPHYAGSVAADETSFQDTMASLRTDANWYRVVLEYEDGSTQVSPAVPAQWVITAET